jgi:hypothetical protein
LNESFLAYICKEKIMYLRIAEVFILQNNWVGKSQIRKLQKNGPQIANPQIATFAEGP